MEPTRCAGSSSPIVREFLASYPALAFRRRIAAGCRLLRAGEAAAALQILAGAVPGDANETIELAYCQGFGLTMEAYRLRREGDADQARAALTEAMDRVEPHVPAARASGHSRLVELAETLDKELDQLTRREGAPAHDARTSSGRAYRPEARRR